MSVPRSKIVVVLFDSISLETCRRVSTFVLDALRELARDRQVIVFSQEEEVRASPRIKFSLDAITDDSSKNLANDWKVIRELIR